MAQSKKYRVLCWGSCKDKAGVVVGRPCYLADAEGRVIAQEGDVTDRINPKSISWLLEGGHIEPADGEQPTEDGEA